MEGTAPRGALPKVRGIIDDNPGLIEHLPDQVWVHDRGRIHEQGSHEELMQLNGRYAHLITLQARGYR